MDLCQTWRGEKTKSFEKFSKKIQTGFLRFEYSGHGKSSNKLRKEIFRNGQTMHAS
jgi:hypothetical protein